MREGTDPAGWGDALVLQGSVEDISKFKQAGGVALNRPDSDGVRPSDCLAELARCTWQTPDWEQTVARVEAARLVGIPVAERSVTIYEYKGSRTPHAVRIEDNPEIAALETGAGL